MIKIQWAAILGFLFCAYAYPSNLEIGGTYRTSQDWNVDTLYVTSDLEMIPQDGEQITIRPGTVLVFDDCGLNIREEGVTIMGTSEDSIIFTAKDSAVGWTGISAWGLNYAFKIAYCRLEHCNRYSVMTLVQDTSGSIEIEHCTFSNNDSRALYLSQQSRNIEQPVIVKNCEFINNNDVMDLVVNSAVIDSNYFRANECNRDKNCVVYHLSWPSDGYITVSNNIFSENICDNVLSLWQRKITVRNNVFERNIGSNWDFGGAALLISDTYESVIENNAFIENKMIRDTGMAGHDWGGGAIYINGTREHQQTISNNLFVGNRAVTGGAVHLNYVWNCTFVNNTFTKNAASHGPAVYVESTLGNIIDFHNNIFAENRSVNPDTSISQFSSYNNYRQDTTNFLFTNCLFDQPDSTFIPEAYLNCIYDDPSFADPATDDYSLQAQSACIDAGDTAGFGLLSYDTDVGGNPRIDGAQIDIGAYEFQHSTAVVSLPARSAPMRRQVKYRAIVGKNPHAAFEKCYLPNGTLIRGRTAGRGLPFGVYVIEQ